MSDSSYTEFPTEDILSEQWSAIVLADWLASPLTSYAIAVLFSGCVLYDPTNGFSLLGLVVESYGRGVCVDVHSDKALSIDDFGCLVSDEPAISRYPHAAVHHIVRPVQELRLAITCRNFGIIVTESWRMDNHIKSSRASIGAGCAEAFPIKDFGDIKIFIDKYSLRQASDILSGKLVPTFNVELLRQLQSRLCSEHTYRMARASWFKLANVVSVKPVTIFTYNVVDPCDTDQALFSELFYHIAYAVYKGGRNATLAKATVFDLLNRARTDGHGEIALKRLIFIFGNKNEIPVVKVKKGSWLETFLDMTALYLLPTLKILDSQLVLPKLDTDLALPCSQGFWL